MTIAPGSRLGPYEIVSRLGAGGMGEVFRARDTRLDRSVAIKVLPAELAHNEQFRLRFEREAKTISQLNHPNICTLYDVGEAPVSGAPAPLRVSYLVMELLEGESVADRVSRGPLPMRDVIRYGIEIAEALDKAHRAGIVHRDLKPGNIMITKSGAKLLDFGLAKSNVVDMSLDAATQHKPLTQEGTILGTFQYMAPEQLEGEEADARTDIFGFGTVLYEMATGRRAFEGKTKTSLIAAIVKENPRPIAELQPLTPPAFEHVVDKCLAKDADDRWQSAHDIASELRWISSAGSQAGVPAPLTSARMRRKRLLAIAAALGWLFAIGGAVAAAVFASRWRAASRVTQTEIAGAIASGLDAPLTVSPDGRRVATLVIDGKAQKLSIRDLATGEARTLAGTEGAGFPFWAPDGNAVGFFSGAKLKTVNADTGAIQTICDAPFGRGGTWSSLGVIVFAPNIASPLMKVSENGGTPVPVTNTHREGQTHRNPAFLPDGKHFLYCVGDVKDFLNASEVHAGSIDGGFDRKVLDYASNLAYAGGWLLTIRDRNLIAQRFGAGALESKGKPVAIAQNIEWYAPRWQGTFTVGGDTLVYQHAAQPKRQLLRLDALDGRTAAVADAGYLTIPALSPDGRRVVVNRFDVATHSSDLWMYDLAGGPATRLTFDARGTMEDGAVFSPDGQRIALSIFAARGASRLWIQPAGGGTRETLASGAGDFTVIEDWSRDGKALLVSPQRSKSGQDIEVIRLDGDRKSTPLVHSDASEMGGRFSPDAKWIAYQSDESGRFEIYVTNYPAATAKWQVSAGGGTRPFWSSDGRQLFFLTPEGRVVATAVHEGDSFSADAPRPVEALGDKIVDFAVAQNGRMVALREIDSGQAPLSVVVNWQELLRGK
ncbi:MAG: protein kinase [Acidobacteriota bacterium]|nr:protein kinase [Acidobacteriota bacterium]